MAYQFVNRETGKASIQKQGTTTAVSIAGVNTKTTDAEMFHRAIVMFVGIVNWQVGDLSRIVTQDVDITS